MTSRRSLAGTILALLALVAPLSAIYMQMESKEVPVERLVANLERELAADPRNVGKIINLARLHAMAYALKSDALPAVVLKEGAEQPWYGYETRHVPPKVATTSSGAQKTAAAQHLKKAIGYYESALALEP